MPYFALEYETIDNFLDKRQPFRQVHLKHVEAAHERGELLLAGALTDPVDRALLIFRAQDRSVPEAFAQHDPYVTNGLVPRWQVRQWAQVIATTTNEDLPVKHPALPR